MDQEAHQLLTSISCQYLSNHDLKLFTEGALTTCCGRLFQCGTTRWLKKYFRTCSLARGINSFMLWPLSVLTVGDNWKKVVCQPYLCHSESCKPRWDPHASVSVHVKAVLGTSTVYHKTCDLNILPSWLPSAELSPNTQCLLPNMVTKPATILHVWSDIGFIQQLETFSVNFPKVKSFLII